MCSLCSSVIMWPWVFEWTTINQAIYFAKWHFWIIYFQLVGTLFTMYGTHFYRKFISKEVAPPVPEWRKPKKDPFQDGKGKAAYQIKKKPPPVKKPEPS